MKVAIIGTGRMGGAMAKRLAILGHELILWNRGRERAEALGVGRVANTPAEAAAAADFVLSILTGPAAVRAALLGTDGAAAGAHGQVYIEMSTAGPGPAGQLLDAVKTTGAAVVEGPVLGSTPAVEAGKLVILAGGDASAVERARPLLQDLGELRHVGGLGQGNRLKLIANSMLAGASALAAELQAAGQSAGLTAEDTFYVLARIVPYLDMRRAGYLEGTYQPVTFALKDMHKDLELALEALDAEMPITGVVRQLYADVLTAQGEAEMSAINARFRRG